MTWLFEAAGLIGVALYIGSYAALQTGLIGGRGYVYVTANLAASALVLVSLSNNFNLWAAVIQITWIGISLVGLTRLYLVSRRLTFDPEEQVLLDAGMPDMPLTLARGMIDAGRWACGDEGDVLAREGERIEDLCFLSAGTASVLLGGKLIARLDAPAFVGEVTALHGGTATATVKLDTQGRYFAVSASSLRSMAARDAEFRVHLQYVLSRGTREKLVSANLRLRDAN